MHKSTRELETTGAALLAADEVTFSVLDDRLGKLELVHSEPSNICKKVMDKLAAKQKEEEERSWWEQLFDWA